MNEYTPTIRARMVARLMGPNAVSATALSKETGISQATLSRWKRAAAKIPEMAKKAAPKSENKGPSSTGKPGTKRTGIQKLALVEQPAGLEGEELGAFLRREGVHLAELEQWRKIASEALGAPKRQAPSKELRRIRAELARKDKALAETAALLVLKKSGGDLGGRGRRHQGDERLMLLELIDEAVASGAPLYKACKVVGIAPTTLARWRANPAPRMVVGARTRPHETP